MSDVMLLAVLEMPPELWSGDPMDVAQRHSRYKQAAQRIRDDAEKIEKLLRLLKTAHALLGQNFPSSDKTNLQASIREALAGENNK